MVIRHVSHSHAHLCSWWRGISAGGLPMSVWLHIHCGFRRSFRPRRPLLRSQTHRLNGCHWGRLQKASGGGNEMNCTELLITTSDLLATPLLQECSVLDLVFSVQHWQEAGLWEDPCLRIGWIQGLKNLLQHPKALSFFVKSGETSANMLYFLFVFSASQLHEIHT